MLSLTETLKQYGRFQIGVNELPGFMSFYSNIFRKNKRYISDVITRNDVFDAMDLTARYASSIGEVGLVVAETLGYLQGSKEGAQALRNIMTYLTLGELIKGTAHFLIRYQPVTPEMLRDAKKLRENMRRRKNLEREIKRKLK